MGAAVGHGQRFGETFCLVVDPAGAHRVDVPPVGFRLRVDLGITVGLTGGGEKEPGALLLGQPQGVRGAQRADLECLDRQLVVVDGGGRGGEVQHRINRPGHVDVVGNIGTDQPKQAALGEMPQVGRRTRAKVVQHEHFGTVIQQPLTQVTPQETNPPSDHNPLAIHAHPHLPRLFHEWPPPPQPN